MFYMKEVGTQKDIFLKTLSNHLFSSSNSRYTPANTLVIDDSPIKHMLNLSENVLLLPTWSYGGDASVSLESSPVSGRSCRVPVFSSTWSDDVL